jgi:hypothetical protein
MQFDVRHDHPHAARPPGHEIGGEHRDALGGQLYGTERVDMDLDGTVDVARKTRPPRVPYGRPARGRSRRPSASARRPRGAGFPSSTRLHTCDGPGAQITHGGEHDKVPAPLVRANLAVSSVEEPVRSALVQVQAVVPEVGGDDGDRPLRRSRHPWCASRSASMRGVADTRPHHSSTAASGSCRKIPSPRDSAAGTQARFLASRHRGALPAPSPPSTRVNPTIATTSRRRSTCTVRSMSCSNPTGGETARTLKSALDGANCGCVKRCHSGSVRLGVPSGATGSGSDRFWMIACTALSPNGFSAANSGEYSITDGSAGSGMSFTFSHSLSIISSRGRCRGGGRRRRRAGPSGRGNRRGPPGR